MLAAALLASAARAQGPPADSPAGRLADEARALARAGGLADAADAWAKAVDAEPGRIDHRLEYAALLKSAGWWLRSAEQYKACLALQPDHIGTLIGYGELLNAEYQFAAAIPRFERAAEIAMDPLDRERALVGLGSAQFGLERYGAAAATFTKVLEDRPTSTNALAFLAISRRRLGELEETVRLWTRLLELHPEFSRGRVHRAEAEELLAALHDARRTVEREPGNAAAWTRLAVTLRKQPALDEAARALETAVRLSPTDPGLRYSYGEVLRDLARWREAASQFAAVGPDPELGAAALYNLAWCARRRGNREEESKVWRKAAELNRLDLNAWRRYLETLASGAALDLERSRAAREAEESPADPLAQARLAFAELSRADLPAARRAALGAARADLNDVHAQTALREILGGDQESWRAALEAAAGAAEGAADLARVRAALLILQGKDDESEKVLRGALATGDRDPRTLVALAGILRVRGALDEAAALLEEASGLRPDYVYPKLDMALVCLGRGGAGAAAAAARDAIRIQPANPLGHSLLGMALRLSGDLPAAAAALRRAVALDPADEVGAPRLLLAKVLGMLDRDDQAREVLRGRLPLDPEAMYEAAWRFVKDSYFDRTFRGQDWDAWRRRFEGRLETASEALGATAMMLASLDDRNTRLRSAQQTESLMLGPRSLGAEYSPSGAALASSRTVETKHLDDNVGYIAVTNLHDPGATDQIRKAVESMRRSEGVILDLRGNPGGSDADVPRVEGLFVEAGTPTGRIVSPSGTSEAVAQPPGGGLSSPVLPADKPLVVLIDRNTGSSAESLVAGLKQTGRAVVVGEPTYGKSSIQLPKLLPGGTIILVVGAEHADLKGRIYTGTGIAPDVAVPGSPAGGPPETDAALKRARQLIKKRPAGP